jgi:hypothetical protein
VKISRIIIALALAALSLLFACAPKKPELPMTEVPSGPLLQALAQQQSLSGLKAIASLEVKRGGRKRAFDTVGIVIDAECRLRVEAFGPLGQSLAVLVWNGREYLLQLPDEKEIRQPGRSGIDRILGIDMDGSELCAAITGAIPPRDRSSSVRAFCAQDNTCMLVISHGDEIRRVRILTASADHGLRARVLSQELYRSETLVYQAHYTGEADTRTDFVLPRLVILENSSHDASLAMEYAEADVNVPVDPALFALSAREAGAQ